MSLSVYSKELIATANALAESGKGILAVDESTKTIGKRLGGIQVENTEANRQAYRGMLFTTAGLGDFISGAILYEETLFQSHLDGETMVQKLNKAGIIPGIKVDKGLCPLPGAHSVETVCTVWMVWYNEQQIITRKVHVLQNGVPSYRSRLMDAPLT